MLYLGLHGSGTPLEGVLPNSSPHSLTERNIRSVSVLLLPDKCHPVPLGPFRFPWVSVIVWYLCASPLLTSPVGQELPGNLGEGLARDSAAAKGVPRGS